MPVLRRPSLHAIIFAVLTTIAFCRLDLSSDGFFIGDFKSRATGLRSALAPLLLRYGLPKAFFQNTLSQRKDIDVGSFRQRDISIEMRIPVLPDGGSLNLSAPGWDGVLGTGGRIWPGATLMCHLLRSMRAEVEGSSVLELGCGTGAAGLYAAALGASRVVLTDFEAVAKLADGNIERNSKLFRPGAEVVAKPYEWGQDIMPLIPDGSFDLVIAADIIYKIDSFPSLCETLHRVVKQRLRVGLSAPRILISHQLGRVGEQKHLEMLQLIAAGRGLQIDLFENSQDDSSGVLVLQVTYDEKLDNTRE